MRAGAILELLKDSFSKWEKDKAVRLGAALAYYTVFSLAPLLVIAVAVAGFIFGEEAIRGEIDRQFTDLIGKEGAQFIQTLLRNASNPKEGVFASILGIVALLFGATGVFAELQDALNTIWHVEHKFKGGVVQFLWHRLLSFAMVVSIGFILMASLVVSALIAALGIYLSTIWPGPPLIIYIVQGLNFIVSFLIITLLFAMIYKVLPDAEISWHDVWLGAAVTAFLFTIGKLLIGLYLGRSSIGSVFGAAGSLAIVLVWIYYSAQILFFGAEFTQVYANKYGSRIRSR